jgi:hypothetical protein
MNELRELWQKFLGEVPSDQQFQLWLAMHTPATVKHGILKAAEKNMALHGNMSADYKIRFASAVMNSSTAQKMQDKRKQMQRRPNSTAARNCTQSEPETRRR